MSDSSFPLGDFRPPPGRNMAHGGRRLRTGILLRSPWNPERQAGKSATARFDVTNKDCRKAGAGAAWCL